jgi:LytS/YehU family sensor histidine kinase
MAKKFLLYFALWTLIGLFFGSQAIVYLLYIPTQPWIPTMLRSLAEWYTWALLAPAILALSRRFPLTRDHRRRSIPVLIVAGLVITVVKIVLRFAEGKLIPIIGTMELESMLLATFHINYAYFWIILGIGAAFEYHGKYRERELKAAQLERNLAQAKLDVLRMQLQPHFLFNTLHTISALMQEGEIDTADRMIARLSELLRVVIDNEGAQEVPLRKELQFLQGYLDIQQIRFQERLRVTLDVPDAVADARVPALLLQPLVENAIRHGISPRRSGGAIAIRASRNDGSLRVEVEDDGVGVDTDAAVDRAGVGIANTRARLAELYGAAHRFGFESRAGAGARVVIDIPFRTA